MNLEAFSLEGHKSWVGASAHIGIFMGRTLDLSQMSNERKPGCLGYIGNEKPTQFLWGIIISHDVKIPSQQPVT